MDTFLALADPTRRNIMELLGAGPRSAGEIASHFPVSASAISQHLKSLREAQLIQVRTDAQRRIYRINPIGLRDIDRWLGPYRRFWTNRLDALESRLRAESISVRESRPATTNNAKPQHKQPISKPKQKKGASR
jgi:DNA-binding transcriptional ArsR family regulator